MSAGFIPDDNWIPVNHAADLVIMRLAYALRHSSKPVSGISARGLPALCRLSR
jgi:hypothetical protein